MHTSVLKIVLVYSDDTAKRASHLSIKPKMIGSRLTCRLVGFVFTILCGTTITDAWTGPTAAPPVNNTPPPINVSSSDQTKAGNLNLGSLSVLGNTLLGGTAGSNAYLNFGATSGLHGYGFRDDNGTLEFAELGGNWQSLVGSASVLGGSGASPYVPVFIDASTLANSSLTSNGLSSTENGNFIITGNGYTDGLAVTTTGVEFPDGTIQTTAYAGPPTPAATTKTCTTGHLVALNSCTTPACPTGYVRSGCSFGGTDASIIARQDSSVMPSGTAACYCAAANGDATLPGQTCTVYCIN